MQTFDDMNPATGERLSRVRQTSSAELQQAVQRARAAQPAWAAMEPARRLELLGAVSQRLEQGAQELAELGTREMGKPLASALSEVRGWAKQVKCEAAEVAQAILPEEHETATGYRTNKGPLGEHPPSRRRQRGFWRHFARGGRPGAGVSHQAGAAPALPTGHGSLPANRSRQFATLKW